MPKPILPQTGLFENEDKRLTLVWQQYFVNLTNFPTSGSATAGAQTLPSAPAGFLILNINGADVKVPYYNT